MFMNIHAGKVRNETLIAVLFHIENQYPLQPVCFAAIVLRTKKYSQFERHIETRQTIGGVQFGPRQIVNAITAFVDQLNILSMRV